MPNIVQVDEFGNVEVDEFGNVIVVDVTTPPPPPGSVTPPFTQAGGVGQEEDVGSSDPFDGGRRRQFVEHVLGVEFY